jgi:hypothetical protein
MPETRSTLNGGPDHMDPHAHDRDTFLFTSESVGEGHPGKFSAGMF